MSTDSCFDLTQNWWGAGGPKHHSAYYQLFAAARWSLDALGLALFHLFVSLLEQTKGTIKRFGDEAIHNTENIIALDKPLHDEVSAFYSSILKYWDESTWSLDID